MKCSFCGHIFSEQEAQTSCKNCLMKTGCKLIRCPRCGYETPSTPSWLKKLFKKDDQDGTER